MTPLNPWASNSQDAQNQPEIASLALAPTETPRPQWLTTSALSATKPELSRILDTAIAAIANYKAFPDRRWEFEYWSAGCERILGYTPEELLADQTLWSSRVPAADLEAIVDRAFEDYRLHRPSSVEYPFLHKDGSWRWIISSQFAVWDEASSCWMGTAVFLDITDRKIAQQNQQFLNELHRRLEQLNDAEAILWEAIKSLGEYLNVERVVWQEVNVPEDISHVTQDWRRQADIPSVVGTYRLSELILPDLVERFQRGEAVVVPDVATDPSTAPFADNFAQRGIGAFVGIPCIHEGRWVAVLAINARTPQTWQPDRVALLEATVEKFWSIIQLAKAIQALRNRENFINGILGSITDALIVWDKDWCCTFANDKFLLNIGMSWSEVMGKNIWQIFPDMIGSEPYVLLHQAMKERIGLEYEFYYEPLEMWIGDRVYPMPDGGLAIYSRDISDRKRLEADRQTAEAFLRESEKRYRLIFKCNPQPMWVYDVETLKFLAVNGAAVAKYGYSETEFLSMTIADIRSPEDIPRLLENIGQVTQGIDAAGIWHHRLKDGRLILVEIVSHVLEFSGRRAELVLANDITDRLQAQLAREESEAFLSSIYDGVRASIFVVDVTEDNHFLYRSLNLSAQELTGLTLQEFQHKTPEQVFGPELGKRLCQNYQRCLQANQSITYEEQLFWRDRLIWVLTTLSPLRNESGRIYRLVGTSVEITDRKQAEIAFQEQIAREQLIKNITQNIRETLDIEEVLQRTVDQVRDFLKADRVVIFKFQPDWSGKVMNESVHPDYPAIIHIDIFDPCFADRWLDIYRQGLVSTRSDFSSEEIQPCYRELMQPFQVKANLVVPIVLQSDRLWGLLIVHQCSAPRQWQITEIELMKQLSIQLGIAIQQSELYQQTHQELLERQKAQQALLESEQRLKAILEYSPALICLLDRDNRYLLANQRCAALLNTTTDQVIGKNIYDFFAPEIADTFAINNRYVIEHNQVIEVEETLPIGDEVHTYISWKFPFANSLGEVYAVFGISTDITDRKKAENKIAEQAALLNISTDAIFVKDLEHRILFWNQGAERLYGWTAAEVLGQKTEKLFNQKEQHQEALEKTLAQGSWQGELQQITKTKQKIIVDSSWTLVENLFDRAKSILIVNSDITEKKQLEEQFYHAQRLESIGTLAGGIAHDFNNILTPILGISEILPLKLTNVDARTKQQLAYLTMSARRGADLVKQILLFSRSTEGQLVTLQLGYVLLEVSGIAQHTFPKAIAIKTQIPTKELWTISADAIQMHQVFMNLMVNARDAMPQGGNLTISAENRQLDENYAAMNLEAKSGAYVVVRVADTGSGIAPEVLDRIFDPFFTTKETGKGTGLGLSTVMGIVKNHGGFIKVNTELEKGTTFQVFLPANSGEVSSKSLAEVIPRGQGEMILIVDDEMLIQEITKTTLENYNYRTLTASDAIEALSIYVENKQEVKVIIMDMIMPNLDPVTAIDILQKMNPRLKIIAISGLLSNQQLALKANVNRFLLKPYTSRQLLQTLAEAIAES